MIAKKNSGYDLERKRSAFFTLGLMVTSSLTLAAFTYSDPMLKADKGRAVEPILIAMDYQTETPKEKEEKIEVDIVVPKDEPKTQDPSINVDPTVGELITKTGNTNEIKTGVNVDTGGLPSGPEISKGSKEKVKPAPVFDIVDKEASFVGGPVEMLKYINSNVEYPEMSIIAEEEGKVYVAFVIEKDGKVSNVEIERGVSKTLDREAKRVVNSFPDWIPGEIDMQPVRTRVRLPIVFTLK